MGPRLPKKHLADCLAGHPQVVSHSLLAHASLGSDPEHVRFGKSGLRKLVPTGGPSLHEGIPVVITARSEEEVKGLAANPSIAGMQNTQSFWDTSHKDLVGDDMGGCCPPFTTGAAAEVTVPTGICGFRPVPASAFRRCVAHDPQKRLVSGQAVWSSGHAKSLPAGVTQ